MKNNLLDDHIGCFGEFNFHDPVCKKWCALNIRCAIEHENATKLELLEELTEPNLLYMKVQ